MTDLAAAYAALPVGVRKAVCHDIAPLLPAWADGEDADQMAWLAVADLTPRYAGRGGGGLAGFLAVTFGNRMKNLARCGRGFARNRIGQRIRDDAAPIHHLEAQVAGRPDYTATPDLASAAACAELLRALPDQERHVLWLCAVEGLSLAQAARRLGLRKSTTHDLYHRAVRLARDFWQGDAA